MKFVAIIMVFIGYVLVYAGVANEGKFATQPWMGILDDAYSSSSSVSNSGSPNTSGSTSPSATPPKHATHTIGSKKTESTSPVSPPTGGSPILSIFNFITGRG